MKITPGIVAAAGIVACAGTAILAAAARRSASRSKIAPLQAVPYVDPERYVGRWFEIARYPTRFERKCDKNTTAHYHLIDSSRLRIVNQCVRRDGRFETVAGIARITDRDSNAKLSVKFSRFMPAAPYWIIDLDPEYRYAAVGEPSRRYLWILAREPRLPDSAFDAICERLAAQGYDLHGLVRTRQD